MISVIVPVYNVEKYLNKCIDSILQQCYSNFEILLVDDGSTDSSSVICEEYAKADSRVRVIHKKNGGLSSARKCGVENALGQYIMFVDGDDWIEQNTLSDTFSVIEKHGVDCVLFSYTKEYENKSIPLSILSEDFFADTEEKVLKIYHRFFGLIGEELATPEFADSFSPCCMKLYKREFALNGKYYDTREVGSSEDSLFNIYALKDAKTLYYLNKPLYHYRKNNSSSLTNGYRKDLAKKWEKLYDYMNEAIVKLELPDICCSALQNRIVLGIIGIGLSEIHNKSKKDGKKNIRDFLTTDRYIAACARLETRYFPLKWRLFFNCCKMKKLTMVYFLLKAMDYLRKRK